MPVFHSEKKDAPEWAEVEDFSIIHLPCDQKQSFTQQSKRELYIVGRGFPVFTSGTIECKVPSGGYFSPPLDFKEVKIYAWHHDVLLIRVMGHWESIATAGIFELFNVSNPRRDGLPYDKYKTSNIDNHYHDYDEYWFFYEGRAQVVAGGIIHEVGPGDCLVTPMGWHHDCVSVKDDAHIHAGWFAATPRGKKRIGHLHEQRDGKAIPQIPLPSNNISMP